jgi:NADH-quinone oxidoreductase subunit J
MAEVAFFIAASGAIAGAVGTVTLRNPFHSVLALVVHLLMLAALFLLLRAEFVAVAQVIIYVGAVMVLYVFVVAYVGAAAPQMQVGGGRPLRALSLLFAGVLLVELSIAMLGSGLMVLGEVGTGWFEGFGSPTEIGRLLLTKFLLAFELASLLLLVAAVGAVVLARRRAGLEPPEDTLSAGELMRGESPGTTSKARAETMLEAGGQ